MPRTGTVAGGMGDVMLRYDEIEALQSEVGRHLTAIEELYGRICRIATTGASIEVSRPASGAKVAGKARKGGRAKRGALKAAIHEVLAGGKPLVPAAVVKALPGVGFRSGSEPRVLYNTVYIALNKDKAIAKTPEGFKLKGAGKAKAPAAKPEAKAKEPAKK
jgi:hypothetical protein